MDGLVPEGETLLWFVWKDKSSAGKDEQHSYKRHYYLVNKNWSKDNQT